MELALGFTRTLIESPESIREQEKVIREKSDTLGLQLLGIYSTVGQTDFKALKEIIRSQKLPPKYLIVSHPDRLIRDIPEAMKMIKELETEFNMKVIDKIGPVDLAAPSKFIQDLLASGKEQQWSTMHSMRIKAGIKAAKERKANKIKR